MYSVVPGRLSWILLKARHALEWEELKLAGKLVQLIRSVRDTLFRFLLDLVDHICRQRQLAGFQVWLALERSKLN